MNFFGIGLPEIILVLLITLIIVGPQRLPGMAVQIARALRQLRGYATDATTQIRAELDELTKEYEEVRKELRELRQATGAAVASIAEEVNEEVSLITEDANRALQGSQPIVESSADPSPAKGPQDSTSS